MEDLRQYLKSEEKSYADGVALYLKYHGNDVHMKFFKQLNDSDENTPQWKLLIQKLSNRLRILAASQPEEPSNIKIVPAQPIQIRKLEIGAAKVNVELKLNEEKLPDNIRELYIRNKGLMIEIAGHHGAMKSAKDDAGRKFNLEMLTMLQEEKDANWRLIDEYLKTNKDAIAVKGDAADKRIDTLKRNIRRVNMEVTEKKNMYTSRQLAKRKENLKLWKKELDDLTKHK